MVTVSQTHQEIADSLGISRSTLKKRLKSMSLDEAVKKPNRIKGSKSSFNNVKAVCPICKKQWTAVLEWEWMGCIPARKNCPRCALDANNYLNINYINHLP